MRGNPRPWRVNPHGALSAPGFSLWELLLVVLLLGIALYLALPAYQQQVLMGNRGVGVAQLRVLQSQQERFYAQHGRYTNSFADLGYPDNALAINARGETVSTNDSGRIYRFDLSTALAGYVLWAAPQLAQVEDQQCHTLSIDGMGVQANSGSSHRERCWQ